MIWIKKLIIEYLNEAAHQVAKATGESSRHIDLTDQEAVEIHNEMNVLFNHLIKIRQTFEAKHNTMIEKNGNIQDTDKE
jgi:uncharacterized coiled-coil DUF342 family protein